jgi:hypothetical protein
MLECQEFVLTSSQAGRMSMSETDYHVSGIQYPASGGWGLVRLRMHPVVQDLLEVVF